MKSSTWVQLVACAAATGADDGVDDCDDDCNYSAGNRLCGEYLLMKDGNVTRPKPWSYHSLELPIWALPLVASGRRQGWESFYSGSGSSARLASLLDMLVSQAADKLLERGHMNA